MDYMKILLQQLAVEDHQELHDALENLVPLVEDERTRIANEMDW